MDRFITQNETPREVVSMRWTLTRQQLSDFSFSLRLKCIVNVLSFTRMTEVLLIEPRMHPEAALAVFDDASSASHFSGNYIASIVKYFVTFPWKFFRRNCIDVGATCSLLGILTQGLGEDIDCVEFL